MADLVPHPLVVQVGIGLSATVGNPQLTQAVNNLRSATAWAALVAYTAASGGAAAPSSTAMEAAIDAATPQPAALVNAVAQRVAEQPELRDLTLFAGYLGPYVTRNGEDWRLLFLDARLERWLLVPRDGIVGEQRHDDDTAAYGKRDAMWVRGDALVVQGHGPQSVEGRFLAGDLTRAADVAPAPAAGTRAAATGLFCDATPSCCIGRRSR